MTEEFYDRQTYVIVGKQGETGRRIEGLRIAFEVFKDDTSAPNRAKITLWNLNAETAALFKREDTVVQLFAGYQGQANLVFLGDVTRAVTTIEGPDAKTVVESGDGQAAASTTPAKVNLKGGTNLGTAIKTALKDAVSDPAAAIKGLGDDITNTKLPRGSSATGSIRKVLRGLARARRFDWSYQDGQLVLLAPDSATRERAVRLDPGTGLIGTPARLTGKGAKGIQFQSLLNGRIRPRRLIDLESTTFTGFFLARKVTHRGDSGWAQDYLTIIEGTEVPT